MTIILLQIAALAVLALLLRGSAPEPQPQEIREPTERDLKNR